MLALAGVAGFRSTAVFNSSPKGLAAMTFRSSLALIPVLCLGLLAWGVGTALRGDPIESTNDRRVIQPRLSGDASAVEETPRNIILLIGDGMGPQQVGLLFDWAEASGHESTEFEQLMRTGEIGIVRTGATDSPLTDSAASATSIATGIRTRNGYVGVGPDGERLTTVLELAANRGMKTGLVTSTRVTHATPACFAAHVDDRGQEAEIARQLVASPTDIILGGGKYYFLSDAHNLREPIEAAGWRVVTDGAGLQAASQTASQEGRTLGLFSDSHLPYLIDRDAPGEKTTPSLPDLTRAALRLLAPAKKGFFLMVEGGRIDHAGHANDVAGVLGEMREFDRVLGIALEYQRDHPETLVLVTADHETGGLCITKGKKNLSPQDFIDIGNATASAEVLVPDGKLPATTEAAPFGVGRSDFYPKSARPLTFGGISRSAGWNVSFGSQGHSTTPVYILARGPGAPAFGGLHHHTTVGQQLVDWLRPASQ